MTHQPSASAGSSGFLIGLALGGLMLVLLYVAQGAPEPQPVNTVVRTPTPVEQWQAAPAPSREDDQASEKTATVTAAAPLPASLPQPVTLEYRFLGKMTDRGVTTVVLHAAGRTLKVRGLGPVDDEYAVDTLQDGYLVLRDIRRGTSRLVEFTSPPPTTAAAWTAGETPPD